MLDVHVAEAHARELPDHIRDAGNGIADADRRVLAMLGARGAIRGKTVAKTEAPTDKVEELSLVK
jgi:hypothetical protein